jgi:hypothetical protein
MANRKTLIIIAGNPHWIEAQEVTNADASLGLLGWLISLVITVAGIGGFMGLMIWLFG